MDKRDLRLAATLRRALRDPAAVSQLMMAGALAEGSERRVRPSMCATPSRGVERRSSARMHVGLEARLLITDSFGTKARHALVTDVGPGGLGVRFRGHPPERGPVKLELVSADGCELKGEFSWLHGGMWCTSAGICLAQESAAVWCAALHEAAREEQPA